MRQALVVAAAIAMVACGSGSSTAEREAVLEVVASPREPHSTLSYGDSRQTGRLGTYCWTQELGVDVCADAFPLPPKSFIEVPRETTVRLESDAEQLDAALAVPQGDPPFIQLRPVSDLGLQDYFGKISAPPGDYWLDVFAVWPQGDASFTFGVRVLPRSP
jgi:hypothetical protein